MILIYSDLNLSKSAIVLILTWMVRFSISTNDGVLVTFDVYCIIADIIEDAGFIVVRMMSLDFIRIIYFQLQNNVGNRTSSVY